MVGMHKLQNSMKAILPELLIKEENLFIPFPYAIPILKIA